MIRLVVTRVEDDGTETSLGEVRLAEVGAGVFSHLSTAEGSRVVADIVSRLHGGSGRTTVAVVAPRRPYRRERGTLQ